jgi:hypothetical protein
VEEHLEVWNLLDWHTQQQHPKAKKFILEHLQRELIKRKLVLHSCLKFLPNIEGRFQATGTPMAKILRLHLSARCALKEITILQLKKLKKIFHCKDLGILKTSFKIVSKEQSTRR